MMNHNDKEKGGLDKILHSKDDISFVKTKFDYEKTKWEELKRRSTFKIIRRGEQDTDIKKQI